MSRVSQQQNQPGMEVSCLALGALFSYLDHVGHDASPLADGLPYSLKHLRSPHGRIDFRSFETLHARMRAMFPDDPDVFYRAGLKVFELRSFGVQHVVAALAGSSPRFLYHLTPRMLRQHFTFVDAVFEGTGHRSCRLAYHFQPGYRVFPEFVDVVRGIMAGMTVPSTGRPATVREELTPDGFALNISWDRAKPLHLRLYDGTVGRVRALRGAVRELERGHTLLEGQLAEAHQLSHRLETLLTVGQSVAQGLDPDEIVTRFSDALDRQMGIRVVLVELRDGRRIGDDRCARLLPPSEATYAASAKDHFRSVLVPEPRDGMPARLWVFPLDGQAAPLGRIVLGALGTPLAPTDQTLLRDALLRLRYALENVFHYQALDEHHRTLEQKVADRTAEIRSHADRLWVSNEKLKQVDEAKRRFFTHMTHELKNPITLLTSSVEALAQRLEQQAALAPAARDQLLDMTRVAQQNIKRVGIAADDLMDLALLEESRLVPRLVPVDLARLVGEVVDEASLWAAKLAVTTTIDVQATLPRVAGDVRLLGKLLLNVLGNAIKFSPKNDTVTVQVLAYDDQVRVHVLDRGPGIPADRRERIFQPFEQTHDGRMLRTERGIGIGLSLVKQIALLHRGDVWVEDRPGGGSKFVLTLPRAPNELDRGGTSLTAEIREAGPALGDLAEAQLASASYDLPLLLPDQPAPQANGAAASITRTWPDQRKRRVLLIDDEADILRAVGGMLEQDFEVMLAPSAEAALEHIDRYAPDAVVSDILMPGISGMELCQVLRGRATTRNTPILLMTALGELHYKLRGLAQSADDYITKPFQYAELAARIRTQIRVRELTTDAVAFSNIAAIGTMAAGIAHEMKNPLNVLLNCLEPLRAEIDALGGSPRADTLMGLIVEHSERLRDTTLSFSNLVSHTATPIPLDVAALVHDLIKTRGARTMDRVRLHVSNGVHEHVTLPKGRFSLVLGNLLDNAIDAVVAREGEGRVDVAMDRKEGELVVRVTDDGVGMDAELIERSVTLFATTKQPGKGTGLGLSIVRHILQAEGGRFELASTLGKGTTATVWFPITESNNEEGRERRAFAE